MTMNKRTRMATESVAFLAVLSSTIVALNVLGIFFFTRIDMTEGRVFSLSSGSKGILTKVTEPLEITAYFTKDLPPPFNATERHVRDLLGEYEAASNGKLRVRFVDPGSEEGRKDAEADGLKKVAHQKVENDSKQVVEGYRGIVFRYMGESKVIPALGSADGLEYEITQALRQIVGERIEIGVLFGHEGATVASGLSTLKKLLPAYDLVDYSASVPIDPKVKAFLIVSPQTPLSNEELRNLDAFVMNGGSLGIFGGALRIGRSESGYLHATPVSPELNRLLEKWGVRLESSIVADAQCRQVPKQTDSAGLETPVPYPPMPILSLTEAQSRHPAALRLKQARAPFSSPLKLTDVAKSDDNVTVTVLAESSKNSWAISGDSIDLRPRDPSEWQATMTGERGPFALAAAIEGRLPSAFRAQAISSARGQVPEGPKGPERAVKNVHVFVMTSHQIISDEFLPPLDRVVSTEVNAEIAIALNAIDWLAQEDALIAVRAKSAEEPHIELPAPVKAAQDDARLALELRDKDLAVASLDKHKAAVEEWDVTRQRYRVLNTIVMPALFVAFGLIRVRVRKKKRATSTL